MVFCPDENDDGGDDRRLALNWQLKQSAGLNKTIVENG